MRLLPSSIRKLVVCFAAAGGLFVLSACEANPDDYAAQAKLLEDVAKRPGALQNIHRVYIKALGDASGDRSAAQPKAIADAVIEPMMKAYTNNPLDRQARAAILEIFAEMRDPRTLPTLIEALDWKDGTEPLMLSALGTLRYLKIPAGERQKTADAIADAYNKVTGKGRKDNTMRKDLMKAASAIDGKEIVPFLESVVLNENENQPLEYNWAAAAELGQIAEPSSIPTLIKALFVYNPKNPQQRISSAAAAALIRMGKPVVAPLLKVLEGKDPEAKKAAEGFVTAYRRTFPGDNSVDVDRELFEKAAFALGEVGHPDAYAALKARAVDGELRQRVRAASALIRLSLPQGQVAERRQIIQEAYTALPDTKAVFQVQLLRAMRSASDRGLQPFFWQIVSDDSANELLRVVAAENHTLLATAPEAKKALDFFDGPGSKLADMIAGDPNFKSFADDIQVAYNVTKTCGEKLDCYIGKLGDKNPRMARKAAAMVGALGLGNDKAVSALVPVLGHDKFDVRIAAAQAIDVAAVKGSKAAVDKLNQLEEKEEGKSIWKQFQGVALPLRARLSVRH